MSSKEFRTLSGIEVKRTYTGEDLPPSINIGLPGEYPFTRGIHKTMYRERIWTMREFSGYGTPEETNERYRYLLSQGQTGLSVAFDFPTLYGYDSDHEMARGEVGRCGVAVDTLRDMEIIFDSIPLDKITTSMTINGPAPVLWAMYIANAESRGIGKEAIGGTIQNDILKEYIAQKSWMLPPEPSMKLVVDTFEYGSKEVPRWNTISISGYHIREAGSTAVQELAFTLADGMAYVKAGIERGLDVDEFAPRLSFFFNSHNDLLEEVAKFRAARRIWAKFMREEIGAKKSRSWMLRFHVQTAGCSLTAQQPEVNIIRVAYQALAAVLGGCQSLHTNSMDEAYALPTEKAVWIALRTQQVLAHESGITNTVDPLGGSYYVERLTDEMEARANKYFKEIERRGGVLKCIRDGYFQREIADSAALYQKEIEDGVRDVIGVNLFETGEKPRIEVLKIDPEVERRQIERLNEVKARRDESRVERTLEALRKGEEKGENAMPYLVECSKAYATLGEMCDVFRSIYGEYREPLIY
jgi:methylmalonyl-CoA mutase N-terminal domain/subunit